MRALIAIFLIVFTSTGYAEEVVLNCGGGRIYTIDTTKKIMTNSIGVEHQTVFWGDEYIVTINHKENMAFYPDSGFLQFITWVLNRQSLILMSTKTDTQDFGWHPMFPDHTGSAYVSKCVRGF